MVSSLILLLSVSIVLSLDTPFGTVLGNNSGVIGYSNSNSSYTSNLPNYYNEIYTGMKYQCVEYTRRWLVQTQSLTYDSIPCASDIWRLSALNSTVTGESIPFNRVPNSSKCPPRVGSLLIYRRNKFNPVGHVAVITEVGSDYIRVSEQNWDSEYWPGDYSRQLRMRVNQGRYQIVESLEYPVFGWMVYNSEEDEACFDTECRTCPPPNFDPRSNCNYH
jgi:hypothetical protein